MDNKLQGLFITFEGIDGCGKSTQIKLLSDYFIAQGRNIKLIREPGGTKLGERIRSILLDKSDMKLSPKAELFLFEASRAQNIEENILPALQRGEVVICDRFYDSTSCYQGYARSLGLELTNTLNMIATSNLKPNITFLLDISPEDALRRREARGEEDRIEALGLEFQQKVREGFLELAEEEDRIKIVDATRSVEEISEEIISFIEGLI